MARGKARSVRDSMSSTVSDGKRLCVMLNLIDVRVFRLLNFVASCEVGCRAVQKDASPNNGTPEAGSTAPDAKPDGEF